MHEPLAAGIFIIPNGTIIVELVIFLVVLAILRVAVVPRLQGTLRDRQASINAQLKAADEARVRLDAAEKEYREAIAETRAQATRIREEARAEGQAAIRDMRRRAEEEAAQIRARGEAQLESERNDVIAALRDDIGKLAVDISDRIVGEPVGEKAVDDGLVGRYLAGMDAGARAAEEGQDRR